MSCWLTPARAAISDTRAPANPLAANSSTAASRISAFVRSGSRCRSCAAGARRTDRRAWSALFFVAMNSILPSVQTALSTICLTISIIYMILLRMRETTSGPVTSVQPFRRRWAALALLLTAVFMDMVDNQIVTIALPTIQHDVVMPSTALQWIASGYTLAFALTLITGGRLGDRYGHRALFVLGTAGFGASSLLAGLAPDIAVLLTARVLQGVFAGLMVPQVLSFIRSEFPAAEQGKAMGFFGMTFPIGGLAGPLLGAVLTEANVFGWHWRTIFFVNVPIAAAAAIGAAVVMPSPRGRGRGGADVVGVLLLGAALLAVLYPLVQGRSLGWPVWSFLLMAAAIPLLALFAARQRSSERHDREPLIRLGMFRGRAVSVGIVNMLIFYCGLGAFFVLTLHLQDGLHWSPLKTAVAMLPATVGIVAGNGLGMPMAPRLGRRLPMIGLALLLIATAGLILVITRYGSGLTPWQLAVPVVLYGAGLGLGSSSLMLIALTGAQAADAGAVSGVLNTVIQLGAAAGPATIGTAFFASLAAQGSFVHATQLSLYIGLSLFAAAMLACFLLPRAATPVVTPAVTE